MMNSLDEEYSCHTSYLGIIVAKQEPVQSCNANSVPNCDVGSVRNSCLTMLIARR